MSIRNCIAEEDKDEDDVDLDHIVHYAVKNYDFIITTVEPRNFEKRQIFLMREFSDLT